jgi:A/G-specific adenine glycosylase
LRPQTVFVRQAMIAVRKDGHYLLRKGLPGERWTGLWEFMRFPLGADAVKGNGASSGKTRGRNGSAPRALSVQAAARIEQAVRELCGLTVEPGRDAFEFQHTVTRFRIRLLCVVADSRGGELDNRRGNFRWARPEGFRRLALSMPARKFADRLAAPGPDSTAE